MEEAGVTEEVEWQEETTGQSVAVVAVEVWRMEQEEIGASSLSQVRQASELPIGPCGAFWEVE